jgi:hypothetical protein
MSNSGVLVAATIVIIMVAAYAVKSKSYYSTKHPILDEVRENFSKLNPKYAKIPLRTGDSAYTENKEVITLCITNPSTGQYYDINTIMYVALHELAHVITPEGKEEHGTEFKQNFSTLLREAAKAGIYDPRRPIPASYCGTTKN